MVTWQIRRTELVSWAELSLRLKGKAVSVEDGADTYGFLSIFVGHWVGGGGGK